MGEQEVVEYETSVEEVVVEKTVCDRCGVVSDDTGEWVTWETTKVPDPDLGDEAHVCSDCAGVPDALEVKTKRERRKTLRGLARAFGKSFATTTNLASAVASGALLTWAVSMMFALAPPTVIVDEEFGIYAIAIVAVLFVLFEDEI